MAGFMRTNLARSFVNDAAVDPDREVMDQNIQAAIKRGEKMKIDMLEEEGGVLSHEDFASAAGLGQMELLDLVLASKVISVWVEAMKSGRLPAFQVMSGKLLPGLPDVLESINSRSQWGKVNFILTPDGRLGGLRPLDALREGNVAGAVRAAKGYLEAGS